MMVVVDTLPKESHFILAKSTYNTNVIENIFMTEIFRLHGLPKERVSGGDVKVTSNFWKSIFSYLGTQLKFITTYHPQTNGQTERVNHVLEDMLCMYVMEKPSKWEDYLYLVEFPYNNGQ